MLTVVTTYFCQKLFWTIKYLPHSQSSNILGLTLNCHLVFASKCVFQAVVSKAQQLVQKAINTAKNKNKKASKGKVAKKSPVRATKSKVKRGSGKKTESPPEASLRRSSRHSSQVAKLAISECLDVSML